MRIPSEWRANRRRDARKLNLTIRVQAPKATTREQLIDAVEASIRLKRVVAPLTAIHWVDWKKGEGGGANVGRYVDPLLWDALRDFYAAITHPKTRLRVDRPQE